MIKKKSNLNNNQPATKGDLASFKGEMKGEWTLFKGEMKSNLESFKGEIIEAVSGYSQKVEGRLDRIEGGQGKMEARLDKIEATMVTKDYLDEVLTTKLADLRGDLVVLMRKEDNKLKELVDILHKKRVLEPADVARIFSLEPFAKMI